MTLKKNNLNIFPRKYSYGGIMDCLVKSMPLASFYEKKIVIRKTHFLEENYFSENECFFF